VTDRAKVRWQALLRRAPHWVVGLCAAVLWSVMMVGLEVLRGRDLDAVGFAEIGAGGLIVCAFITLFRRWRVARDRKLPPGSATARNLDRAITTGKLPEQAVAEEWVPGLQKIIRQDRRVVWVGPAVFGLFTALSVFLIFDRPDRPWFGAVCSALFLGIAIWSPFSTRRRRLRIEGLIAKLSQHESPRP
jgi:hypothetical protein